MQGVTELKEKEAEEEEGGSESAAGGVGDILHPVPVVFGSLAEL